MKVRVKNDRWIISFNSDVLECKIDKVEKMYVILFSLNNKKIRLKTYHLDETFKLLEKIFDRRSSHTYN